MYYLVGKFMVTIIEVAKKAKVSPSTASRYVRNPDVVSKEKAKRIKAAIEELGYVPNIGASVLKSNVSNMVGLVLPNTYNYLFSSVVCHLASRLNDHNMKLLVLYSSDFEEMKEHIRTLVCLRCNSIVYLPERRSHTITNLTISNDVYPLQLFIDASPVFDSIVVDDFYGTYIATKELLKKGNKNIALVDGDNAVFQKRNEGMKKAYEDLKVPFDEEKQICALGVHTDVIDFVSKHIYKNNNDAIIAVTETIAQQVCLALQQAGKSIPNDISLIVYDDSPWAKLANYSVIAHPIDELVNDIVQLVLNRETRGEKVNKLILHPMFLKRGSIKDRE